MNTNISDLLKNDNITELVDLAEKKAKIFRDDKLKTNQIRNFYSAIAQMRIRFQEAKSKDLKGDTGYIAIQTDLAMLKPNLAYAAGRQFAVKKNFYDFMVDAIKAVEGAENKDKVMNNYFLLIESVVGYHKFYGDK